LKRRIVLAVVLVVIVLTWRPLIRPTLQAVVIVQAQLFGEISLRKHKMFDAVFAGREGEGPARSASLKGIDDQYH